MDTAASGMAIASSGNGLELLHSKAIPHWGLVALWIVFAVGILTFLKVPGLEAWCDSGVRRGALSTFLFITALLPLASRTGRMFAHLLQCWFPVYASGMIAMFAFEWATTGHWALLPLWATGLGASAALLMFRKRLFLSGFAIAMSLGFALHPAVACVDYATMRPAHFATYPECAAAQYREMAPLLGLIALLFFFLIGRTLANDASAW